MSWRALTGLVRYAVDEGGGGGGRGDAILLRLAGELDLASSHPMVDLIEQLGSREPTVIVDLSRVSFADASGLSQLLLGDRLMREIGGELVLRRPHPAVRRLLQLCASGTALTVADAAPWHHPTPDVVAICSEAVEAAIPMGGAAMGNAQLADPTGALRIVAAQGFSRPFLDFFEVVDDTESACGAAAASGKPVYVPDVTRSATFLGTPTLDAVRDAGVGSVASVPLTGNGGTVVGMLSIHRGGPGHWSDDCRRRLGRLADDTSRLLAEVG